MERVNDRAHGRAWLAAGPVMWPLLQHVQYKEQRACSSKVHTASPGLFPGHVAAPAAWLVQSVCTILLLFDQRWVVDCELAPQIHLAGNIWPLTHCILRFSAREGATTTGAPTTATTAMVGGCHPWCVSMDRIGYDEHV